MTYREHIANRPPSPYSLKTKIFTAVLGCVAVVCAVIAFPWTIAFAGFYGLVFDAVYVLALLSCLLVFCLSTKPRRGLHAAICILLSVPILIFTAFLICFFTGVIHVC